MERYLAELQEAKAVMTEEANSVFFFYRQQRDVARIEFPALEMIVKEGMEKKGIPYTFDHENGENILTVQPTGMLRRNMPVITNIRLR